MGKIKVGIVITGPSELKMEVIGGRIKDYTAYFSDKFYDIIQTSIDHDNWAVWFKQSDESKPIFVVDIYVNEKSDWKLIYDIIKSNQDDDPELQLMNRYWDYDYYQQC